MNRKYLVIAVIIVVFLALYDAFFISSPSQNTPLVAPFGEEHKGLEIGDRLCLFGGYWDSSWSDGDEYRSGVIVSFIPTENEDGLVVVVKLDKELEFEDVCGQYLVMQTRYVGQTWNEYGPVHLDLCEVEPQVWPPNENEQWVWIECAASYEFEDIYLEHMTD